MPDRPLLKLRTPEHRAPGALDAVCVSCTAPEDDRLRFAVSDRWKVVLHPDQTLPGAMLIVSLRHVAKVGDLDDDEMVEFFRLYRLVELAVESSLGASMVNLSCLRNWAFRSEHPDPPFSDGHPNPHVHWHVAPRHADPVRIGGQTFIDEDFGSQLTWRARRIDASVASAIIDRVGASLGLTEHTF